MKLFTEDDDICKKAFIIDDENARNLYRGYRCVCEAGHEITVKIFDNETCFTVKAYEGKAELLVHSFDCDSLDSAIAQANTIVKFYNLGIWRERYTSIWRNK